MKVLDKRAALLSDYEVLTLMREMDQHHRSVKSSQSRGHVNDSAPNQESSSLISTNEEEKALLSLPSNLRTIHYSVLEQLSSVSRPCAHQNNKSVPDFLDAVNRWERGREVEGVSVSDNLVETSQERVTATSDPSTALLRGEEEAEETLNFDRANNAKEIVPNTESRRIPRIAKPNRLTKGEKLMLVNQAPQNMVELYTLVEELPLRFTEQQMMELLAIVTKFLPLDTDAIEAEVQRERAMEDGGISIDQGGEVEDQSGNETFAGAGEEDEMAQQDFDALEIEMPGGEDAVDADKPEED